MKTSKDYKCLLNVFDVLSENLENSKYVDFSYFDFEEDDEGLAFGTVEFKYSEEEKINETIYKTICNLFTLSNISFEAEYCSECVEFVFEDYNTFEFNKYRINREL